MNEKEREAKSAQLRLLAEVAMSHTTPLLWTRESDPQRRVAGGTMFFLDCGHGPFAVTADHVYDGYLRRREKEADLWSVVSGRTYLLEERLIDRDSSLDVATFRLTPEETNNQYVTKAAHVHPNPTWPPPPPSVGDLTLISGFTVRERQQLSRTDVAVGLDVYGFNATVVKDSEIVCQYDSQEFLNFRGEPMPMDSPALEGLSGGPVWQMPEHDSGLAVIKIAGVVKEYSREFGLLYVARADFILPDGRLKRP